MQAKALLSAVVVTAVLSGCATPAPRPPINVGALKVKQGKCQTNDECTVAVDVYCDPNDTWKNCTISVDQDFVIVYQGFKARLTWKLRDPVNFAFDREAPGGTGIVFLADADIKDCKLDSSKQTVTCRNDHNNKPGEPVIYKYVISLVKIKGSPRAVDPLDPWIIND